MGALGEWYKKLCFIIKLLKNPSQRKHILKWVETSQEDLFLKKEIPWLTFDAIDFLNTLSLSSKKVFEWGSGGSTQFWLKNGANVVSVEHDRQWYEKMRPALLNKRNIDYKLIEPDESSRIKPDLADPSNPDLYFSSNSNKQTYYKYASAIDQYENNYFDIILIDGRARPSCIKHAISKIKRGGILILDNSDRDYYLSKTCQYLSEFQKITYNGAAPLTPLFSETTIYIKKGGHNF